MRAEDQLRAEEEEEVLEITQGLEEGRDDEQAEEQAVEELPMAARRFTSVVTAMRAFLEGRTVDLEQLEAMSRDELAALDVLRQVVSARDRRGTFIYAENRIERLNQVLSVLQPALSVGNAPGIEAMRDELTVVIDEVEALRDRLSQREDAEEEITPQAEEREAEGDKDDDDDDDDDDLAALAAVPEPGAPARPSILSAGPAVPDKPSPKTTLTGAAVPDKVPAPTTLIDGPPAPDVEPAPTTLLDGPEAPDFEPAPSTLGEPVVTATPRGVFREPPKPLEAAPEPEAAPPPPEPAPTKPARGRKAR